jgi:3-methyladenine DNA glycosylase AlkD
MSMTYSQVIALLQSKRNARNVLGMERFGINPQNTLGISVVEIRKIGKLIGSDHALALELWASGLHEARILASVVDDPERVSSAQMEQWVKAFDSWDVCDQVCLNLFDKTKFAHAKAAAWSKRKREFEKRAGFALMAALAFHDRGAADEAFEKFLPLIHQAAEDERNFVKKAVNWALRQIGKRNARLNRAATKTARKIGQLDSKSARWIASDALRELGSAAVQKKFSKGTP